MTRDEFESKRAENLDRLAEIRETWSKVKQLFLFYYGGLSPPFYLTKSIIYNYNIIMDEIIFEWDPVKADLNYTKHKVTFEEAKSVFYDKNAILIADPDHSSMYEDRFIMLGFSSELHMLVVCHCYRENDRIRIISARKADTLEAAQYGGR